MQYCIYEDSGCNSRPYLEIQIQGAHLSDAQRAFNGSMSSVHVMVEWMFKELKLYWSNLDYKRKLAMDESPVVAVFFECHASNEHTEHNACKSRGAVF